PKKSVQIGSTPFVLRVAAAAGAVRKRISACAASRSFAEVLKPAANPILVCNSSGIGPTRSTPGTPVMRVATTTTMSASPRATTSTVSSAAIGLGLACTCAVFSARTRLDLAWHPALEAEPIEQADEIESARALARIGNGFRRQQRALEGFSRCYVWLGSTLPHGHA